MAIISQGHASLIFFWSRTVCIELLFIFSAWVVMNGKDFPTFYNEYTAKMR